MKAIHYRAGDCVPSKENARFHLQKNMVVAYDFGGHGQGDQNRQQFM